MTALQQHRLQHSHSFVSFNGYISFFLLLHVHNVYESPLNVSSGHIIMCYIRFVIKLTVRYGLCRYCFAFFFRFSWSSFISHYLRRLQCCEHHQCTSFASNAMLNVVNVWRKIWTNAHSETVRERKSFFLAIHKHTSLCRMSVVVGLSSEKKINSLHFIFYAKNVHFFIFFFHIFIDNSSFASFLTAVHFKWLSVW